MSLSRDFVELIACLNASRVEYLLVGGHALAFHGLPRSTGREQDLLYVKKLTGG